MRAGLCPIVNQWAAKQRPRLDFPTPPLDAARVITLDMETPHELRNFFWHGFMNSAKWQSMNS
jgi:hypothetical protein